MRRVLLGLVFVVAAGVGAASCSSSGGSGKATPSPTPFVPTDCALLWENVTASNTIDAYEIDMPVANWTSGVKTCDTTSNRCAYLLGYDPNTQTVTAAGQATSGTFQVTVGTLDKGQPVSFVDSDQQAYFDATVPAGMPLGAQVASGGIGSFSGVWSDPGAGVAPTLGTGTITVMVAGSSKVFGLSSAGTVAGAFGVCEVTSPFAPLSIVDRLALPLQRL